MVRVMNIINTCVCHVPYLCIYIDGIHNISGGTLGINTAGIFATYPREYLTLGNGFFDQVSNLYYRDVNTGT